MRPRVWTLVLIVIAAATACRSGSGALPTTASRDKLPSHGFVAGALPGLSLFPIGPTQMRDPFPTSGKVNAYTVNPKNPRTIYVASGAGTGLEVYSSAGIYRTDDGGTNWRPIDNGLTDTNGVISSVVNALWIDSTRPNVLLAASEYDGLFRSSDGGSHWSNVYRTTTATEFAQVGDTVYAATGAGVLASTDHGASWTVSLSGNSRHSATALASTSGPRGNALYAGLTDGSIYAFENGRWARRGALPFNPNPVEGSTPAVHQIAVDPLRPTVIYASSNDGTETQALFASTDAGVSWHYVLRKKSTIWPQAIAFSVVHPHQLYLGADGSFFYLYADGSAEPLLDNAATLSVIDLRNVWVSANGSDDACWIASDQGLDYVSACSRFSTRPHDDVVSKTVATGLARRFTVSPDGSRVVTSLQDFPSHETFDAGKSWKRLGPLSEDGFNELQPGNAEICYVYDEINGLGVSTDGCLHYRYVSAAAKVFPSRLMTTPLDFNPKHPQTVYLMSGLVAPAGGGEIGAFMTPDYGKTITRLPWPFSHPGMIVVDPTNGNHIVVGDLRSGRSSLSATFDGGNTWSMSSGVPQTAFWYAATMSPAEPNLVLASNVDSSNNVFVLRSTDGGRSFKQVATVTNAPLIRERSTIERANDSDMTFAYVYSPNRQIRFNQDATKGTPYVALTTLRGAFLSTDLGTSWHRIDGALIAHSFWGIRWRQGYLYLASDGQGVVVSTKRLQ